MPKEKKPEKSPLLIACILIVLLFVAGIGIRLIKTPDASVSNTPACQYDPDVCEFFTKLTKTNPSYANAFSAMITSTKKGQAAAQITIKSDKNNNLSITSYKNSALLGESILFNNSVYVKNNKTNTWILSPTPPDSSLRNFREKIFAEIQKTGESASYVFIRGLACKEFTCMKYQRILSKTDPIKTYILFDTKNHILREVITTTDDATTHTVFSYDPVSITSPVSK